MLLVNCLSVFCRCFFVNLQSRKERKNKFIKISKPITDIPAERLMFFKTLWEKEKMLVTSIFSFSHNVFKLIKDESHPCSSINFVSANAFNFSKFYFFVFL